MIAFAKGNLAMEYGPAYQIRASDRALAAQFLDNPFAEPTPDLMRLLNRLRWHPICGKYVLVCTRRHKEWTLARLKGRAEPIELMRDHVFTNLVEAERFVFRLRWKAATGEEI